MANLLFPWPSPAAMQDKFRDEGWGDQNLTAQWYIDLAMTPDDIDDAIEARRVYDYLHGSWQFMSALFLMQQTLDIMAASTGRIEDLDIYAGWAETCGVMQSSKNLP